MKKLLIALLCSFFFVISSYAEYQPLQISGAGKELYAVQEEDTVYGAPKLLESGKKWKVEVRDQLVFVRPQIPGTKEETEIEIPVKEINQKPYVDFSYFSEPAGINYQLDQKKHKLKIKPLKKEKKGKNKKEEKDRILLWDPDLEFDPSSSEFAAKEEKWVSPEWGSYSRLKTGKKSEFDYLKKCRKNDFGIMPLIHNDFDPDQTKKFLHDSAGKERLTDYLTAFSVVYGLEGWNLDFENMYEQDRDDYTAFVRQLTDKLHQSGKKSTVNITVYCEGSPTWSLCYDRKALAGACDYEVLMGYDQTSAYSKYAGSVAAANWLDENLQVLLKQIPADQLILGLPLYTRVWKGQPGYARSDVLTVKYTEDFLKRHKAQKVWDVPSKQYISRFKENDIPFTVWLEDSESLKAKIDLIHKYKLSGMAFWRIGFQKDGLFRELDAAYSQKGKSEKRV